MTAPLANTPSGFA